MGFLALALVGLALVLSAFFLMRNKPSEGYTATTAPAAKTSSTTKKGLLRPNWGWNPKADAAYANKQSQLCTSSGGFITKHSDAFYMCSGSKW